MKYCKNCKYYVGEIFYRHGLGEWGKYYESCSVCNTTRKFTEIDIKGEKHYEYPILDSKRFESHNSPVAGVDYCHFEGDKVYVSIDTLNFDFQCPYYKRKWWKFGVEK